MPQPSDRPPGDSRPAVVFERYPGAASALLPLSSPYRTRRPQDQPLYRIVQAHLETFLAEPLSHGAPPYPRYVEREFRRLLLCGIPAHGFYRIRCPDCGYERLLGLSCAGRLCNSCWARRTADGAAHLVDRVLPSAPYRQLVLSLPYKLRIYLARDPRFLSLRPPVRPQPALPLGGLEQPEHRSLQEDLCTAAGGFSLHAARTVEQHDRDGLEGLCRYGLRAPFSQQRLSVLPNGKVRYELARPWPTPTGVTELIMEPLQLLKRLAVLLPAPYQKLTRYHGVFANRSRFRPLLPLPPEATGDRSQDDDANASVHRCDANPKLVESQPGQQLVLPLGEPGAPLDSGDVGAAAASGSTDEPGATDDALSNQPAVRPRRLPWASLLKRSLGVSGLECPRCGAQMVLLALITAPATVAKILDHLRIPSTPPPVAPARLGDRQSHLLDDDLDQTDPLQDPPSAASELTGGAAVPRAAISLRSQQY